MCYLLAIKQQVDRSMGIIIKNSLLYKKRKIPCKVNFLKQEKEES